MEYMNDGEGYYMRSKNYGLFVEMWGISLQTCMLPFGVLTDLTLNTAVLDTEMTLEEFYYSFIEMAPTLITLQLHGIILRAAPDKHRRVPINFLLHLWLFVTPTISEKSKSEMTAITSQTYGIV
jgi:hypothetical protein